MRLWTAILAGLQILASGSVLADVFPLDKVGLFSLVVAAFQGGTVFYMKSGPADYQAKHAVDDEEGR